MGLNVVKSCRPVRGVQVPGSSSVQVRSLERGHRPGQRRARAQQTVGGAPGSTLGRVAYGRPNSDLASVRLAGPASDAAGTRETGDVSGQQ